MKRWAKVVTELDPVTLDIAAQEFGISRSTIQRLMREEKIGRYIRTGDRRAYVDRDELREVLALRREPSRRPARST